MQKRDVNKYNLLRDIVTRCTVNLQAKSRRDAAI